jgi:hypothetical protein
VFAASQALSKKNWSWIVYENKEGLVLEKGETTLFDNSIKDSVHSSNLALAPGGRSGWSAVM